MTNEKAFPYIEGDVVQKLVQILENNIKCFDDEITHLNGKREEAQNILGQIRYMTEKAEVK
jgi:hypothetical protein